MKHLKHHEESRATVFPAVIGYNRLLSDNKPTHRFLRDTGIEQDKPNYMQLIEFTQRFLQDLYKVDNHSYKKLCSILNDYNTEEKDAKVKKGLSTSDCSYEEICRRLKEVSEH